MPAVPFQAVVFDNDGLLLDTEEAWTRAEETLFERRGRTFTIEHKRYIIGSSRQPCRYSESDISVSRRES